MEKLTIKAEKKVINGVVNLTASKSESNRVLIIRALCEQHFPIHNLAAAKDTKTMVSLLAEKGKVPCVPYVLSQVKNYEHLQKVSKKLGDDLVVQLPFGDSGHTTYFIKDENELENYILTNNKELQKIKKGSKEFTRAYDEEKSRMSIQRFKGLGEMNPEELWSTTLDPETRNLLQVQYSKDLKKDQSLIHTLMGNDVALRKDFIISNAINVQNLDI